jgi:hypothetical protein
MGIQTTTYVIYGIVLNEEQNKHVDDHWEDERFSILKYVEGRPSANDYVLLMDYMGSGEQFFGKMLTSADPLAKSYERIDLDFDDSEFLAHFTDCFEEESSISEDQKPALLVVNHTF